MAGKSKKDVTADGSIRPTKLPQVNKFLQQQGIKNVRLERGQGYFQFWGMPIDKWLNRVVLVDRLDELSLDEWVGEISAIGTAKPAGQSISGKGKAQEEMNSIVVQASACPDCRLKPAPQ